MNIRTFISLIFLLLVFGCATKAIEPHSQITYEAGNQVVWSYLEAFHDDDLYGYLSLDLLEGEEVVLGKDIRVRVKEGILYISGAAIPPEVINVFVSDNGEIHLNSFIRTFD